MILDTIVYNVEKIADENVESGIVAFRGCIYHSRIGEFYRPYSVSSGRSLYVQFSGNPTALRGVIRVTTFGNMFSECNANVHKTVIEKFTDGRWEIIE